MNKVIFLLGTLFLIMIVVILVLYFTYEVPKAKELQEYNIDLNIYTIDYDTTEQISTELEILQDNLSYKIIETVKEGGLKISVPTNHTYSIRNINSKYYTRYYNKGIYGIIESQRIIIELEKPGNLSIIQEGELNLNEKINLRLSTDRRYKRVHFCIRWSVNIITVQSNKDFILTDSPERFTLFNRCYDTDTNLINNQSILNIPLEYKQITKLNDRDYIEVVFYDEDCYKDECIVENLDKKDITGDDKYYKVTTSSNNNIY